MTSLATLRPALRTVGAGEPLLHVQRGREWFAELYEETFDAVFRYAQMLLRDEHRAEDVAAEVFLRAWRARESYRGTGSCKSWLLSITHNVAHSALRATREVADVSLLMDRADGAAGPEAEFFSSVDAGRVQDAIRLLTPEQQQVVFLRFFEGLPHDSVASQMGRNPNAVRAIQFRALGRLRKLLEDDCAEPA
ncbi:MAG: sigma-70 family RNA polymerase sigma factor [Dehalococcoidia bacterium]